MKAVLGTVFIIVMAAVAWFFLGRLEGPAEKTKTPRDSLVETVRIKTQDGVEIAGDYYPVKGEKQVAGGASRGVLLLHMMPADRKSWAAFAKQLSEAGFPALAIDFRGHGESQGGPEGYKSFTDLKHQQSKLDVLAAALFLRSKKVDEFHLVGASIGANLALQYLAEHPNARSAILLSPGLDYRGVTTEDAIQKIRAGRGLYLVSSEEDAYSHDTAARLARYINLDDLHQLKAFTDAGHGTTILEKHPEFMDEMISWLVSIP